MTLQASIETHATPGCRKAKYPFRICKYIIDKVSKLHSWAAILIKLPKKTHTSVCPIACIKTFQKPCQLNFLGALS